MKNNTERNSSEGARPEDPKNVRELKDLLVTAAVGARDIRPSTRQAFQNALYNLSSNPNRTL